MEEEDYYSILGVPQCATIERIREAYRRLALQFHPDKNRDLKATENFQRLGRAWETLKDVRKRAEYDRTYVKISKRHFEEFEPGDFAQARRRREEVDREATTHWSQNASPGLSPADRERAHAWKRMAREDYLSRLERWNKFWNEQSEKVVKCEKFIQSLEQQLGAHCQEGEEQVMRMFLKAISRSHRPLQSHASFLAKLQQGLQDFMIQLGKALDEARAQHQLLVSEIEHARRQYEEEEARVRQDRIMEALKILGPRQMSSETFSLFDSRGRAINHWKALERVQVTPKVPCCCYKEGSSKRPWHQGGEWERLAGEHVCEKCGQIAFHIIPDFRPTRCPGCGMVTCDSCHRDLELLREYSEWLCSENGESCPSLFSLGFEAESVSMKPDREPMAFPMSYRFDTPS